MEIIFVLAMSENRVIGKDKKLPWHLPNDLKHFKALTLNEHVVMGRKTLESIGKALPKRHNLVLTKNKNFCWPNVEVIHSKEELLKKDFARVFIIGGEEIFRLFWPECNRIHLTLVHTVLPGDTFFRKITGFVQLSRKDLKSDPFHAYSYSFIEYVRASS